MKKTDFKNLVKKCITEVLCEKEDYYDGLKREYRKAQKEKNAEKYLYYGQAFNYSAVAGWDQFKGSWAYDNWRKKFAKEIEAINQNWKRYPFHERVIDMISSTTK